MLPKQSAPRRAMRRLRWQLRALVGRDVKPQLELQCRVDKCQENQGGWAICPTHLGSNAIVYSFGIGFDIAWDRYMMARYGVTVHAFDPTPASLNWLKTEDVPPNFVVHPVGLADYDGEALFRPPVKSHHVDYTLLARPETEERAIRVPVARLATIMRDLGHQQIDLLKMDIEGAEYGAIRDIIQSQIPIRQWLIEFHHRFPGVGAKATRAALADLRAAGYQVFAISDSGQEYSLLRAG